MALITAWLWRETFNLCARLVYKQSEAIEPVSH
jgi:hypothetical protein